MTELTREQMQDKFVEAVDDIVQMWGSQVGLAPQAAAEGTAFSILNLLDGTSGQVPQLLLVPADPSFDAPESEEEDGEAVEVWTDEPINGPDVELHTLYMNRISQRVATQVNVDVDEPESIDEE